MTIGTKIAAAFLKAQAEMGNATKDSNNPYFKSKYADLNAVREACLPALNKHGISVLQPIVQMGREVDNRFAEKSYVKTILLHESGETIESLTEILFGKANDAQAQGSGITYARRYGLQSLVCIGAEDDDGNKANEKDKNPAPKNPSGIPQGLVDQATQDLSETAAKESRRKAEAYFAELKAKLEDCGSVAEMDGIIEKETRKLNSLAQKHNDLFVLIQEAREFLKEQMSEDEPDGLSATHLQQKGIL